MSWFWGSSNTDRQARNARLLIVVIVLSVFTPFASTLNFGGSDLVHAEPLQEPEDDLTCVDGLRDFPVELFIDKEAPISRCSEGFIPSEGVDFNQKSTVPDGAVPILVTQSSSDDIPGLQTCYDNDGYDNDGNECTLDTYMVPGGDDAVPDYAYGTYYIDFELDLDAGIYGPNTEVLALRSNNTSSRQYYDSMYIHLHDLNEGNLNIYVTNVDPFEAASWDPAGVPYITYNDPDGRIMAALEQYGVGTCYLGTAAPEDCSGDSTGPGYQGQLDRFRRINITLKIENLRSYDGESEIAPVRVEYTYLDAPGGPQVVGSDGTFLDPASGTTTVYLLSTLQQFELETGDYRVCMPEFGPEGTGNSESIQMLDTDFQHCSVVNVPDADEGDEATFDIDAPQLVMQEAIYLGDPEKQCSGGGIGIGWILCPIATGLYTAIDFVYENLFIPLLMVEPLNNGSSASESQAALYQIWNTFRILATVSFIFIFLVALMGASGSFVLTQYEIKKMLPRIVIGIILAQLSWYLVSFAVDLTNVIGAGIRGIILSPVQGLQTFDFDFGGDRVNQILTIVLLRGGLGVFNIAGAVKGVLMLLPIILLPILLAVAMAYIILLIRQLVILLLVVTSPIALIAWVLPNTSSITKFWSDLFWKALMMYPIIVAMVAGGHLVSATLLVGTDTSFLYQIIAIIAMFTPFFLIPYSFSMATGALANIASGLTKYRQPLSDRILGDVRDSGSMRGNYREYRRQYRRQNQWKRFERYNAASSAIRGVRPGILDRSKRNGINVFSGRYQGEGTGSWLKRNAYAGYQFGAGFFGIPGSYLRTRFGLESIDTIYGKAQKDAHKTVEALYHGHKDALFALFGDYNPITGKRIDQDIINQVVRHRGNSVMMTAALKNMLKKHGGSIEEMEKITNHFAQWREDTKGELEGRGKKSKDALGARFKNGIWIGAAFGAQKEFRDLKHRAWDKKKKDGNYGLIKDNKIKGMLNEGSNLLDARELIAHGPTYAQGLNEVQDRLHTLLGARKVAEQGTTNDVQNFARNNFDSIVTNLDGKERAEWEAWRKGTLSWDDATLRQKLRDSEKVGGSGQAKSDELRQDVENLSKMRSQYLDIMAAGRGGLLGEDEEQSAELQGQQSATADLAGDPEQEASQYLSGKTIKYKRADVQRRLQIEEAIKDHDAKLPGTKFADKSYKEQKELLSLAIADLNKPGSALSQQTKAQINEDDVTAAQREAERQILGSASQLGSLGAHKETIKFIEETSWVNDPKTLRKLNSTMENGDSIIDVGSILR